ncbi:GDSL esterase/lipase At2g31550-like [Typha latifolia]|uniref:GDSL esterase/lipase At2g31550-like n=1 Tax=Typha latifolia TaxID=4733 RepID=UPI003C2DA9F9
MAQLLLFLVLLFSCITENISKDAGEQPPKFSAIFYFGDSSLDTGNNGYIPTLAIAKHYPYGQDFPGNKATGRFSNGRLVPDFLSAELGLKQFSRPFMDPTLSDKDILTGANFASAGSGFDDATSAVTNTIPMSRQLKMFKLYLERLRKIAGEEEGARIVGNALIFISSGTNDFVVSFYDLPNRRGEFNISEYQNFVLHKVHNAVKELYNLGARLFCVAGLPPIGCIPLQITVSRTHHLLDRACVAEQNSDSIVYNAELQKLLLKMQQSLSGSKFVYIDSYEFLMEILKHPTKYGFRETSRGCCGTGLTEVGPLCNYLTPTCLNVPSYVFYDAVHPSEKVYRLATDYIMKQIISQLE